MKHDLWWAVDTIETNGFMVFKLKFNMSASCRDCHRDQSSVNCTKRTEKEKERKSCLNLLPHKTTYQLTYRRKWHRWLKHVRHLGEFDTNCVAQAQNTCSAFRSISTVLSISLTYTLLITPSTKEVVHRVPKRMPLNSWQ